jgi:hypothetical protein
MQAERIRGSGGGSHLSSLAKQREPQADLQVEGLRVDAVDCVGRATCLLGEPLRHFDLMHV